MFSRHPADGPPVQREDVARRRPATFWVSSPVGVYVVGQIVLAAADVQVVRNNPAVDDTMGFCALKVSKNSPKSSPVPRARAVQVL